MPAGPDSGLLRADRRRGAGAGSGGAPAAARRRTLGTCTADRDHGLVDRTRTQTPPRPSPSARRSPTPRWPCSTNRPALPCRASPARSSSAAVAWRWATGGGPRSAPSASSPTRKPRRRTALSHRRPRALARRRAPRAPRPARRPDQTARAPHRAWRSRPRSPGIRRSRTRWRAHELRPGDAAGCARGACRARRRCRQCATSCASLPDYSRRRPSSRLERLPLLPNVVQDRARRAAHARLPRWQRHARTARSDVPDRPPAAPSRRCGPNCWAPTTSSGATTFDLGGHSLLTARAAQEDRAPHRSARGDASVHLREPAPDRHGLRARRLTAA